MILIVLKWENSDTLLTRVVMASGAARYFFPKKSNTSTSKKLKDELNLVPVTSNIWKRKTTV